MKNYIYLFSLLLLAACGSSASKEEGKGENKGDKSSGSITQAVTDFAVAIKDNAGAELGRIDIKSSAITIGQGGNNLVSEVKGDKRKYGSASGQVAVEVKHNEADKFKLRTPEGQLIWKIKIDGDKIKVSDNDENNNPYQLRRGDNKIKVKDANDAELGTVELENGKVVVKSAGRSFSAETDKLSAAYGVLLMDKVSARDQFIIMAELIAKGQ